MQVRGCPRYASGEREGAKLRKRKLGSGRVFLLWKVSRSTTRISHGPFPRCNHKHFTSDDPPLPLRCSEPVSSWTLDRHAASSLDPWGLPTSSMNAPVCTRFLQGPVFQIRRRRKPGQITVALSDVPNASLIGSNSKSQLSSPTTNMIDGVGASS